MRRVMKKRAATKRETSNPAPKKQAEEKKIERVKTQIDEPEEGLYDEIADEFREVQKFAQGNSLIKRKLIEETNSDVDPGLAGNDPDANWTEAGTSGDESVVGGNPSPDQD